MSFSTKSLSFVLALVLVQRVSAVCQSYGTDYVDGGGPYCINTDLTDYFSFGTEFFGCSASDTQGGVTPILISPNTDEFYCSDIATNPDGTTMLSTCNVAGNQVTKNNMLSGSWTVVIEGLTFAYMRTFQIIAGPPVFVTSTPTATYFVTSTPVATATSTSTAVIPTTLTASTVTVPSTTVTQTSTVTPRPVTTSTTSYLAVTLVTNVFTKTVKTVTVTTACSTLAPRQDVKCTISPSKATLLPRSTSKAKARRGRFERDMGLERSMHRGAEARGLLENRSPDLCTTTILVTTNIPSTTTTIVAPTSTFTTVTAVTVTSTVTPSPVTAYSGKASVTITKTLPTVTITLTNIGITTKYLTVTNVATLISTVKVAPSGAACIGSK